MAKDKIEETLDNGSQVPEWMQEADQSLDVASPEETQTGLVSVTSPSAPDSSLVLDEETPTTGRVYQQDLDFEPGELGIPRLKMASGMTAEVTAGEARSGQWIVSGYPAMDEVTIVPFGVTRFREFRNMEAQVTYCQSPDGRKGDGQYGPGSTENPTGSCKLCPMAQWKVQGEGKPNLPPPCSNGFSYQVYVKETDSCAVLDLKRTGMDAADKINFQIQMRKMPNFAVILKSEIKTRQTGGTKFPAPKADTRPSTPEERAALMNQIGSL